MARNTDRTAQDRVVSPASADRNLFRIHAVEAHSWTTVILEDKFGRFFIAAPSAGRLEPVERRAVETWLAERTYRIWNGDRAWSPLSRLPLLSATPVDWGTVAEADASL